MSLRPPSQYFNSAIGGTTGTAYDALQHELMAEKPRRSAVRATRPSGH
jgi:hypothetical protein